VYRLHISLWRQILRTLVWRHVFLCQTPYLTERIDVILHQNNFWNELSFSLRWRKRSQTKVMEDYYWAITHVVGRSCCGRSGSSVPQFRFKNASLAYRNKIADLMHSQFPVAQNSAWARPPEASLLRNSWSVITCIVNGKRFGIKLYSPFDTQSRNFTTRHWAKLQRAWTSIAHVPAGNQTKNFHKNTVHKASSVILLINLQLLQFIQHRYINYDVTRRHCQDKSRITTVGYYENT
jgi:hypothetical protein